VYTVVNKSNWDPSTDTTVETNGVLNSATYPAGAIFIVTNGLTFSKSFSAPQGVLFYVTSGNVSVGGNGSIFLNPLTPNFEQPTKPTPELVLWDASNGTLTLGGNGNTTVVNGGIYAPNATTVLNGGGNSGGLTAQSMVVGPVTCNGGNEVVNISGNVGSTSATVVSPNTSAVPVGTPITAHVLVEVSPAGTPNGTVKVYECGPGADAGGCGLTSGWAPAAGNLVDGSVLMSSTTPGTTSGNSLPFRPLVQGTYCFAAYYQGTNYPSSQDLSSSGCFTAIGIPPQPPIVIDPVNGTCYGNGGCAPWPGSIDGTVSDIGGTGTLASVQVSIQNQTSLKYFDPGTNSFSSTTVKWIVVPVSGTGPTPWSTTFQTGWFSNGNNNYTLTAEAFDTLGNTSAPTTVTFQKK
jgi:hypothetical protein